MNITHNFRKISALMAMSMLAMSCSQDLVDDAGSLTTPEGGIMEIVATSGSVSSRTMLEPNLDGDDADNVPDTYSILWRSGDKISLFGDDGVAVDFVSGIAMGGSAKSATFSGNEVSRVNAGDVMYALYPHSDTAVAHYDDETLLFTASSVQPYDQTRNGETFANNVMPVVAKSLDYNAFSFQCVYGVFQLKLTCDEGAVESAKFIANDANVALWGDVEVAMSGDDYSTTVENSAEDKNIISIGFSSLEDAPLSISNPRYVTFAVPANVGTDYSVEIVLTTGQKLVARGKSEVPSTAIAAGKVLLAEYNIPSNYTGPEIDLDEKTVTVVDIRDLEWVAAATNAGTTEFTDGKVYNGFDGYTINLDADIKVNTDAAFESNPSQWVTIGVPATPFKGVFNGNDHTISNVYMGKGNSRGLFGSCTNNSISKKVEINNLKLDKVKMNLDKNSGFIAGQGYGLKINNCHITNATLLPTTSTDAADAAINVGGFVGLVNNMVATGCSITNLTNGDVCNKGTIGAMFGATTSNSALTVDDCHAKDIDIYSGNENIGGVLGYFVGGADDDHLPLLKIVNSSVENAEFERKANYTGALVGRAYRATVEVDNCDITNVKVETVAGAVGGVVGGFIGISGAGASGGISITNCDIDQFNVNATTNNVGGLVGFVAYGVDASGCNITNSSLKAKFAVGGLIGNTSVNTARHTLTNCNVKDSSFNIFATGAQGVGGITAMSYAGTKIIGCSVTGGSIRSDLTLYVGGIVSSATGTLIKDCYTSTALSVGATGNNAFVGGIAGNVAVGSSSLIIGCKSSSDISFSLTPGKSDALQARFGGIVGTSAGNILITGCYNDGHINNPTPHGDQSVTAGIIGNQTAGAIVNVVGCYNNGVIEANPTIGVGNAGQIFGVSLNGSVKDCYYTSAAVEGSSVKGPIGIDSTVEVTGGGLLEVGVSGPTVNDEGFGVQPAVWSAGDYEKLWGADYSIWESPWNNGYIAALPTLKVVDSVD